MNKLRFDFTGNNMYKKNVPDLNNVHFTSFGRNFNKHLWAITRPLKWAQKEWASDAFLVDNPILE